MTLCWRPSCVSISRNVNHTHCTEFVRHLAHGAILAFQLGYSYGNDLEAQLSRCTVRNSVENGANEAMDLPHAAFSTRPRQSHHCL